MYLVVSCCFRCFSSQKVMEHFLQFSEEFVDKVIAQLTVASFTEICPCTFSLSNTTHYRKKAYK